jgi:sodium transport system permease protein
MTLALLIARKEIRDHLRDGKALLSAAMMALMGPGVVLLVTMSDRVKGDSGPLILSMLSVFALVSSFAGAIDVAMDVTAGERERKSLLPLLLNPVTASEVVIGKWIAVTVFSLGTLVLNSVGLLVVLAWSHPALLTARGPQLAIWIGLGLVPLSCLGAAVNLLLAVTCRSTKEAHTALRFLAFVPMVIGMFLVFFSTAPGGPGRFWQLMPIVGQQVLAGLSASAVSVGSAVPLTIITLMSVAPILWGAIRLMQRSSIQAT